MTRFEILKQIQQEFPNTEKEKVLCLISELEHRLHQEIFSIIGEPEPPKNGEELNSIPLCADTNSSLYIFYISSYLALQDEDFARANAFGELFNQIYSELAVSIRRLHKPITSHHLKGGDLF